MWMNGTVHLNRFVPLFFSTIWTRIACHIFVQKSLITSPMLAIRAFERLSELTRRCTTAFVLYSMRSLQSNCRMLMVLWAGRGTLWYGRHFVNVAQSSLWTSMSTWQGKMRTCLSVSVWVRTILTGLLSRTTLVKNSCASGSFCALCKRSILVTFWILFNKRCVHHFLFPSS